MLVRDRPSVSTKAPMDQGCDWKCDPWGIYTADVIRYQLQHAANRFPLGINEAQAEALRLYRWRLTFEMRGLPPPARDTVEWLLDEVVNAFLVAPSDERSGGQAMEGLLRYLEAPSR